ncbi:RNA polymerase-associated protein RapA [Saliniradius amylolyticus]|uniref:RNA polymerase-associated protein RapA n=1 Tax=Saliniradius amylolyticus TaxID=2183582 RepID=A0A2S2E077_9ALTE|nr:RNA polymerase-associated protein RapA [Saliniradius amylolyticus]AWL11051.1 RNA polymerase-associated protein RapA [Saliniradius amylolyticus]
MTFSLGQRWASQAESELGLGTIVETQGRRVSVLFPATGETRTYTADNAPLIRVRFDIGDTVSSHQGWQLEVEQVHEQQGCLTYIGHRLDSGQPEQLKEPMLDHRFTLASPQQRLLSGQFDEPRWFELRRQGRAEMATHHSSALLGLTGARVDLIPHQLHIARTVADRHAPRVLLSDEVGLGKTIEAAMIIHRQLLTGRAQRVLIVVPEALLHQWLVEMLRRINVQFAIFDQSRCQALAEEANNPFDTEQCVLCSLDFLTQNPDYAQQAAECHWDLLVVDEAHHLTWQPEAPSAEYQVIEHFTRQTPGVLLLTATPDQLGHASHFARLRLLDPDRFYDYQQFLAEEQGYQALAQAIRPLLANGTLDEQQEQTLIDYAPDLEAEIQSLTQSNQSRRQALIEQLIDRHGTGRLVFRNTRHSVPGFPKRCLHPHPLGSPDEYVGIWQPTTALEQQLLPETYEGIKASWTEFDPRIPWLIEQLKQRKGQKVLTLCANNTTALALAEALRHKAGTHAGVFHQGQSIVERDRIANYFADPEQGTDVLICSEIGSEGRNFQFAQHLVLFDLPLVPDVLEQRIGRLDRIGQQGDIHIHVPYFKDTAQQRLLNWYHQGLNAFEHTCATGTAIFEQFADGLYQLLPSCADEAAFEQLLTQTRIANDQLKLQLEQGRDRLLELNASGLGQVEPLLEALQDLDNSPRLERFMLRLLDAIGVAQEELSDTIYLLRPTEAMNTVVPGLTEDGLRVTYDRATALAREDVQFISWDHPLVHHVTDWLASEPQGNSAIGLMRNPELPNGSYYLQLLYTVDGRAEPGLQLGRFLPPTPVEVVLDANGKLGTPEFTDIKAVPKDTGLQLVKALSDSIELGLQRGMREAEQRKQDLVTQSLTTMERSLDDELQRLVHLQKLNPSIRDSEIQALRRQKTELGNAIESAEVQLEAIRLVVNTH